MSVSAIEIGICKEVPSHHPKILVVEDEPGIVEIDSIVLGAVGYEVEEVNNAEEAVQRIEGEDPPNLILSDNNLAGEMKGLDLAERNGFLPSHIPFILRTADDVPPEELKKRRIDCLIRKPFKLEVVEETIARLLSQSQSSQPQTVFQAS